MEDNGRTALTVSNTTIAGRTVTRATDNAWEAGDAIGITMLEAGSTTTVTGNPLAGKYVTADGTGAFAPADKANTLYYPTQNKKADIVAFYPYTELTGETVVPVNVSDQTKLAAIDLMVADKVTDKSATDAEVSLAFRHKLVKLELTVDCNESAEGVDLSKAAVALHGTATTATWDLIAATLTTDASSVKAIAIPVNHNATSNTLSGTAIVLPGDAKDVKLVITAGEYAFDVPFTAGMALKAGTKNTLKVHLNRTEATVEASVEDWTTGVTVDLESLKLTTAGTDGNLAEVESLQLWLADKADAKVTYTWDATAEAWNTTTPFYLEGLKEDALFFARHTPEATDAVTGLADVLGNTTGVAVKDGGIALTLEHLMARLNITVAHGTNFPESVSLEGATITLPGVKPEAEFDDANVTTATGDAKTLTLSAATPYIIVPQTLAAGTAVTVNLKNGNSYRTTLAEAVELKQGTTNTLALTLDPTATAIALSVKEWETGTEASAQLALVITGTPDTPQGSAPTFTALSLQLAEAPVKNFSSATSGARLGTTYAYEYADGAWKSTNPIYLDELPATAVVYANVYNTDAEGADILDEVTGLKDALVAGPVAIKGGAAAIEFRHALAQLTVKTAKGAGFTPDLAGATVTTPALAKSARMNTDADGLLYFAAGTETTTYTIADEEAHLVVPQTIAAGSVFSVKLSNGNTYEAALAEAVTLEAGKNTTLTLTLKPTAAGIKTTVTDWGTAAASAEVKLAGITDGTVSITAAEGDRLTIAYGTDLTATYTYTAGAWASNAPLYWDDIAKNTFTGTFSAEYIFATKTTPVEDKLTGTLTGATYGSELSFTLSHTTAKMSFTFKGDGASITDAEVAAFTKTIALGSETYTIADAAMHFAPQTLTDANVITLTRSNGNTYTVKLSELMNGTAALFTGGKVEAGKHYAITLTVSETSVGIKAEIADWTTVNGSGSMTPDWAD